MKGEAIATSLIVGFEYVARRGSTGWFPIGRQWTVVGTESGQHGVGDHDCAVYAVSMNFLDGLCAISLFICPGLLRTYVCTIKA